ncbi:MAG: putative quinol monooxygenase [Chthoniobacteraceae bacterium]
MNTFKKYTILALAAAAAACFSTQSAKAEIPLQPAANGEVTLVVDFDVKPAAEAEFEAYFRRSVTGARQEPGNILFNVHKVIGSEHSYVLYEIWRNKDAVKFHFAQPYTVELFKMFDRDLTHPLELHFLQDLDPQPRSTPATVNGEAKK